jgi:hypothetical protein
MKKFYSLLILSVVFFSCTDMTNDAVQNCGAVSNTPFESFTYCGLLKENPKQSSFVIINSNEDLLKIFNTCPTVNVSLPDFTQKRILGLFAGPKPTGGFGIKIQSIQEDDCQIVVQYFETEPKKDEVVATLLTYPSDYVVLPKSNKPIAFQKVYKNNDYIVIGTYYGQCVGNECLTFFRMDSQKVLRYLNATYGLYDFNELRYKSLAYKDDLASFYSKIPLEIKNLKGQTKTFGSPDSADQGGVYFELHQGDIVTKIFLDNDKTADQNDTVLNFKKSIQDKIVELKGKI